MPNTSKKKKVEDSIDNCIEIAWAEEEAEKMDDKKAKRCVRRGDDDRASWYEQRTWESYIKKRFYDKIIDRASE